MHNRKLYLTALWSAGYLGLSLIGSILPWFEFWQLLILLMPFYGLGAALCWTRSFPDYSSTPELKAQPIEDYDPPARKVLWLNGLWDFKLPSDRRWHRIESPRSWNTIHGLDYYEGIGVYRRLFTIPEDWNLGRIFLNFQAVNYRAVVSIDGKKVGRHEGGHTPFRFDITDSIADGREFELEVMVENRLDQSTVPNVMGWRNEGGILREVFIETRHAINITDVQAVCEPDLKGRAQVDLKVKIDNPEWEPKDYLIEVFSPQGALVHEHREESWSMQNLEHSFDVTFVALWSPDNPALYTCRVTLLGEREDQHVIRFGIRKIAIDSGNIMLNGKQLAVRGITRISEFFDTGAVQPLAAMKKDFQMIKDAGFNLVRLGATAAHPKALEICDKLGLLVLEELPAWCGMSFELSDPHYQQAAESQLREMILRDRNHPCVLMWGLAHNIDNESAEGRWFIEQVAKVARSLDGRPVYLAVSGSGEADRCADAVDAVLVIQRGNLPSQLDRIVTQTIAWKEAARGKPVMPLFLGHGALRGAALRLNRLLSEESQALFLQEFIKRFDAHKNIAGWIIGNFADHRDPSNFLGPVPFMRLHGIVNHWREPKTSYDVIKKLLTTGVSTSITPAAKRVPLTYFSIAVASVLAIIIGILWVMLGKDATALLYKPNLFIHNHPGAGWIAALLLLATTAISWTVIISRYFRSAPRRLTAAIDMPYFIIVSRILRSERITFAWSFLTLIFFWVLDSTLIHLCLHSDWSFTKTAVMAGAMSAPDAIFLLSGFFRVPLWPVVAAFHIWKFALAFMVFGPIGAILYVLVGPAVVVFTFLAFAEANFHILKYIRR